MVKYLRFLVALLFLFQLQQAAFATHNRAGEIVLEQINGCESLTLRATIITYTKTSSVPADRDTLTLCWGDGFCQRVARVNGPQPNPNFAPQGEELPNNIKFNLYIAEHTYPGRNTYQISMTDPNRNDGILNVNPPGSVNVPFHIQSTYTFLNPQFQGCNNTPRLLQPPVDIACIGQPFVHNPNAFDLDGDSLSYRLVKPLQAVNVPVPNYTFPPDVQGNDGSTLNLNEITGDLVWDNPQVRGEYNIAMIIISWRNGFPIDTVLRDMQIRVEDCEENLPPDIQAPDELCVVAGEVVKFQVTATDPDAGDKVKLSALGGPFEVPISPADDRELWRPFGNPSAQYQSQPVVKTFRWQTTCEHISNQPYTIIFKAIDDVFDTTGLATLKTVRIKVVGPAPQDVQAVPGRTFVDVSWEKPYVCENAANDFFFGFSVWRREGSNQFTIDTCTPGLAGKGYIEIEQNTRMEVDGRYFFKDTDVERGRTYCYRLLAKFAKLTDLDPPKPFNIVESLPSDEICVQLSRDVPLITNVSIEATAPANGKILIRWTKPLAEDLDTILNGGPYRYELSRGTGLSPADFNLVPGASFSSPSFAQLNQNEFNDEAPELNTMDNGYSYKVAFFVNGEVEPLGFSPAASSVFLSIASTDETNNLFWDFDVPWDNFEYSVWRKNANNSYDSIATVTEPFYSDKGLLNGKEFCYFVKARGSYGIEGIPSPLINLSQEACGIPLDSIPPCPPVLTVTNVCDDNINCDSNIPFVNRLSWSNPNNICDETDDVVFFNVYFAETEGQELQLVAKIEPSTDTTFSHTPPNGGIAGCYAVTAVDTFFNESRFSNIFCVDNCPNYTLPNTFTPNGDAHNDLFVPFPFCFIERVEMEIYNRWGQVVYETTDPHINWDGKNKSGEDLPDGTYYYISKVFEQRVSGVTPAKKILRGHIDLIRGTR